MKNSFAKDISRLRDILSLMEALGGNDPASAQPWLRLQNELESLMNNRVEEWLALARVADEMRKAYQKNVTGTPVQINVQAESAVKEYDKLMKGGVAALKEEEC